MFQLVDLDFLGSFFVDPLARVGSGGPSDGALVGIILGPILGFLLLIACIVAAACACHKHTKKTLPEEPRTVLFACCFLGLWIPPMWLAAGIVVALRLKDAPASAYKSSMTVFLVLTPVFFVVFIISTILAPRDVSISAGITLSFYAVSGSLFIMFADMTFRSKYGPVTTDLTSPLNLRGVHLGLNLAGLFLLMPLFSFVGIPLVLHHLRKLKSHSSALFVSSYVFGILSFVTLSAAMLLLFSVASLPPREFFDFPIFFLVCLLPAFAWLFMFVFIGVADTLILKAIAPTPTIVPSTALGTVVVVHRTTSANSPSPDASKFANFSKIDSASEFKSIR